MKRQGQPIQNKEEGEKKNYLVFRSFCQGGFTLPSPLTTTREATAFGATGGALFASFLGIWEAFISADLFSMSARFHAGTFL